MVAKGNKGRGGKDWEFGTSRCKLLYIGWINKVLFRAQLIYSTACDKPLWKGVRKDCIYITVLLCCTAEINTTL